MREWGGRRGSRGREGPAGREGREGQQGREGQSGMEGQAGLRGRRGRTVYSRGPIVRVIEVILLFSAVCAIAALVFSLVSFSGRITQAQEHVDILQSQTQAVQRSRRVAIEDTCIKLREVIDQAYSGPRQLQLPAILPNGSRILLVITTPSQKRQAQKQIQADGLVNCALHARKLTSLHH